MPLSTFLILTTIGNLALYTIIWQYAGWWTVPTAILLHVAFAPLNMRLIKVAARTRTTTQLYLIKE